VGVDAWEAERGTYQRTLTVLRRVQWMCAGGANDDDDDDTGSVDPWDAPEGDGDDDAGDPGRLHRPATVTAAMGWGSGRDEPVDPPAAPGSLGGPARPRSRRASLAALGLGADVAAGLRTRRHRAVRLCGDDLLDSFARPGVWSDAHLAEIVWGHGLACVVRGGGAGGGGAS